MHEKGSGEKAEWKKSEVKKENSKPRARISKSCVGSAKVV